MSNFLSYPKARSLQFKMFRLLRTDNSTVKALLPKDAVVVGVFVNQQTLATGGTATPTFNVGWAGTPAALASVLPMSRTTLRGFVPSGDNTGAQVGVVQTADRQIISTMVPGDSTGGGEGYAVIAYFLVGAGETLVS